MVRYQVILAYDGTGFHGFQRQAKARTVQEVVEKALRRLHWKGRYLMAAGRTDTGVHATGQVVAFDLDWKHSSGDLQQALNANLPQDVVARSVRPVTAHFNPRRDAISRLYRYHIFVDDVRDPLRERYAWRIWPALDLLMLQESASMLVGKHDFAAFGSPPCAGGSTVRTVLQAGWKQHEAGLSFEVDADAFLYRMVRRMVALQVAIGHGKQDLEALQACLRPQPVVQDGQPIYVQGLAPAQGLFLCEVRYPLEKLGEEPGSL